MSKRGSAELKPWMLFALPVAMVVPIAAAFLLAGPIAGLPVAVLIAIAIVVAAIRPTDRAGTAPAGGDHEWRRAAARRFLAPAAIAVGGVVMVIATDDTARIIGWTVVALAITIAVSLVFLEIGYSEDRARRQQR